MAERKQPNGAILQSDRVPDWRKLQYKPQTHAEYLAGLKTPRKRESPFVWPSDPDYDETAAAQARRQKAKDTGN